VIKKAFTLLFIFFVQQLVYSAVGDSLIIGGKNVAIEDAEKRLEYLPKYIQTKLAITISRVLTEEAPEKSLKYAEMALQNIISGQTANNVSLNELPKAQLAQVYYLRGRALTNLGDNDLAIKNYFSAIDNLERITTYNENKFDIYCNISNTYSANNQFELAWKYLTTADSIGKKIAKPEKTANLYYTKAMYYASMQNTDSAQLYLKEIMKYPDSNLYIFLKGKAALRLSVINFANSEYIRAINYAFQSIHYAQRTGQTNNLLESYISLISSYNELNRTTEIKSVIALVNTTVNWHKVSNIQKFNWELTKSRFYEKNGDLKSATQCLNSAIQQMNTERTFQRSLVSENISRQFEIQQKEKEIEILKLNSFIETQKQLKIRLLQYFFVIIIAFIAVAFGLAYRNRKTKTKNQLTILQQREEIAREKLITNINQSQLRATKAQLTGQELERDRIGKELHDGVGGALAGIKLTLEATPYTSVTQDFVNMIKSMIHKTTQEVRLISHNLVLPSFHNATLEDNVEDLFEDILIKNGIKVSYSVYPTKNWDIYQSNIYRIQLYRVIQEIFTNIYKHAKASEVEIQIVKNNESLIITIEDNGVGFDITEAKRNGIGIKNIQSRTDFLDAKLSFDSMPLKGTFISIEIPLKSKIIDANE